MDTCIRVAESLHCSPETITTLLISYSPIQNKKLKKKKNLRGEPQIYDCFIALGNCTIHFFNSMKGIISSILGGVARRASQVVQVVENLPASAGDTRDVGSFLGWKDPLEEERATHSSILAWKMPWTEEPGGLQSVRLQRVRQHWAHMNKHTLTHTHTYILTHTHTHTHTHTKN